MVWQPRYYRQNMEADGLVGFEVVHGETDLHIAARRELRAEASRLVVGLRGELDAYVAAHPRFAESFVPVQVEESAPRVVRAMAEAAEVAGVGPMAAVAGAVAEEVARGLEGLSSEVIVENGGDLYLIGATARRVQLLAGDSPLSGTMALAIAADALPRAVCTSSGTVGHSISLGSAHAVTIVSVSGARADAAASAVGNLVHGPNDIERALERALSIPGVLGAVIVVGDRFGAQGDIVLEPAGERTGHY